MKQASLPHSSLKNGSMNNTNNHTTSFGQTTASKTSIEAKQRQSHPLKLFQIPVNALNQSVIKKA